jgi:DNA gyrase/topoisomerase IV subunit B
LLEAVVDMAKVDYQGPIHVAVEDKGEGHAILLHFSDLAISALSTGKLTKGGAMPWPNEMAPFAFAVSASDRFAVASCDGTQTVTLKVANGVRVSTTRRAGRGRPFLKIRFVPAAASFPPLSPQQLYSIAGLLRDHSLLRPGLATRLTADVLAHGLSYYYRDGLKNFLLEEDHCRWPLHEGCLSFASSTKEMSVEGHLRFLHAGVPIMHSYVNGHRTMGGAHLEGLGMALSKMFPDSRRGCRCLEFVTNPDTGAKVKVPHSFLGAMQIRIRAPHYYGPTKDVLMGDDVREFVASAATKTLCEQWRALGKP